MKTTNYDKEDRNKHLEFIQNAINRMASNSFILKGWSVTLVTGIIALSLTTSTTKFIYLAFIPTLAFWGLDAYYLRQEKLFRELYDYVRAKEIKNIEPFSLNTLIVKDNVGSWLSICFSKCVVYLHLMILLILIVLSIWG
ncbi:MAG: hypothetical protein AB1668_04545 [Nanoarchaeota archaeon]